MKLLSVLIPTLLNRKQTLHELIGFLRRQIEKVQDVKGEVEILTMEDSGETPVGTKRNNLLDMANGKFSAFVDDDDWVSDTYVKDIVEVIKRQDDLECIGFYGEVYFQGVFGGKMIHSITCPEWTEEPGLYLRPPNHLNPIRTDIARRFKFRDIFTSEDHFWSIDIRNAKVLTHEVFLGHKPLYIYRCSTPKRGL